MQSSSSDFFARARARRLRLRGLDEAVIEAKVKARIDARGEKDFAKADAIRAELSAMGVELQDVPGGGGTTWRIANLAPGATPPRRACRSRASRCARTSGSLDRSASTLRTALMTVVWSRLPKARPSSGKLHLRRCLQRYIATWRANAMLLCRSFDRRSVERSLKWWQTTRWMSSTLASFGRAVVVAAILGPRERQVDGAAEERRLGRQTDERSLELADVAADHLRDEQAHVVGQLDVLELRLLADDRDARLELRRLDVGHEAPLEARHEALLHLVELLGVLVARDDDLLARLMKRVERVEKLFLRLRLAGEEMDVVDEEQVALSR